MRPNKAKTNQNAKPKQKLNLKIDYILLFACLILVVFGAFMVHSASSVSAELR